MGRHVSRQSGPAWTDHLHGFAVCALNFGGNGLAGGRGIESDELSGADFAGNNAALITATTIVSHGRRTG